MHAYIHTYVHTYRQADRQADPQQYRILAETDMCFLPELRIALAWPILDEYALWESNIAMENPPFFR